MTFNDALVSLIGVLRQRGYSPRTIENYTDQLARFGQWLARAGQIDLRGVGKSTMNAYQAFVSTEAIAADTKALRLRAAKRLFEHLVNDGVLLLNPAEHLVEIRRRDRLPRPVLTVREMDRLLAQPNTNLPIGIRDRALLELLYGTAIRVGELEQLTLSDVSLASGTLHVRSGKGARDRVVPLGKTAIVWLRTYVTEVRPAFVKTRPFERALFVVLGGRALGQTQIRDRLRVYQASAKIKKATTPHLLRHSCATHLLQNGADIRTIQELLGHVRLQSTVIYTRVAPIDVKETHRRYHPRELGRAD
jgi:integrase/recombinase XerD